MSIATTPIPGIQNTFSGPWCLKVWVFGAPPQNRNNIFSVSFGPGPPFIRLCQCCGSVSAPQKKAPDCRFSFWLGTPQLSPLLSNFPSFLIPDGNIQPLVPPFLSFCCPNAHPYLPYARSFFHLCPATPLRHQVATMLSEAITSVLQNSGESQHILAPSQSGSSVCGPSLSDFESCSSPKGG